MKDNHLNDVEIQQFLFQENQLSSDISDHIQQCAECRNKTEQYKLIFNLVRVQEKPVFDFKLEELVMQKIHLGKPWFSFGLSLFYLFVFIAVPIAGVSIYLFSTLLSYLLEGFAPILLYLIITTVLIIMLFQCADTYIQYNNRMKALDFYQELQH